MSDVRFKISGDSPTFYVSVTNLNSITETYDSDNISISGSCVSLGGLAPSTQYTLRVKDIIGCSKSYNFTTPANVGTTTLATKTISLEGTFFNPPNTTYSGLNADMEKRVKISPSLSVGESVSLNICGYGLQIGNGITNMTFKKRCGIGGSYQTLFTSAGGAAPPPTYSCDVTLNYGDDLCYDGASQITSQNIYSLGRISFTLRNVSSSGFNAVIGNCNIMDEISYTPPTTTTTTTLAPLENVSVSVTNIVNLSSSSAKQCFCGKLTPSRPLNSNESFRLYFTDSVNLSANILNATISSCAYATIGTTEYNLINGSITNGNSGIFSDSKYGYIDVNMGNINNITLFSVNQANNVNPSIRYYMNTTNVLNSITNKVGANFILGSTKTVNATCNNVGTVGGGGGTL